MDITAMPVYFVTNHKHNGVYVNGVAQKSGVTVNDFSTPVYNAEERIKLQATL